MQLHSRACLLKLLLQGIRIFLLQPLLHNLRGSIDDVFRLFETETGHLLHNFDDVDFLVVGNIVLPELQSVISDEQAKREAEINYSSMDEAEFKFRVKRRDPFILGILIQPKIMLLGDEDELLEGVMA